MSAHKRTIFPKYLGFSPYIWLFYMLIPIFNMAFEHGLKRALGYGLIVLFIVAYRQLFVTKRFFPYWLALQMLIILTLSFLYLPFYLFMGFFTANALGTYENNRKFSIALTALIVTVVLPIPLNAYRLTTPDYLTLIPFIIIMVATPFGIRSLNIRRQLELQLKEAKERIEVLVKREERQRISRDLHDTLGHTLSLITLKSQLVHRLIDKDPEKAKHETREIEHTSRAALKQVRELVSNMRAITITEGLEEARLTLHSADISLKVIGESSLEDIPDLTQNMLSMCIKEAVTNIVKHSRATTCSIVIERSHSEIRMAIEDNGIGMGEAASISQGNGLKGMAERLSLINGTLAISSPEGEGAMLNIVVPIIIKEKEECDTA